MGRYAEQSADNVGHIVPTQIVKFEANMSFVPSNTSDFFSDKTLATWNTLMPGRIATVISQATGLLTV